jgi:hypothetical protein
MTVGYAEIPIAYGNVWLCVFPPSEMLRLAKPAIGCATVRVIRSGYRKLRSGQAVGANSSFRALGKP